MSTNTEFLGLIKPAQEDFYNIDDFNQNFQKIDDFAKRKDNPHNVTAEQVGAARSGVLAMIGSETTIAETIQSLYDNKIYWGGFSATGSSDSPELDEPVGIEFRLLFGDDFVVVATIRQGATYERQYNGHTKIWVTDWVLKYDNKHKPTPQDIGAAPSGYGLGTNIVFTENANTIIATGFYYTNVNTPSGAWSYINHYQYPTIGYAFQSAYSVDAKVQCSRRCVEGTWGEWEYENPPMMPGVEYRTTKRHNGQPVYTKLINFGALSNASVDIGTSSVISLYGFTTWVYTTDDNALYHDTFPVFGTNGNLYAVAYIRNNDLCVKCFDTSGGIENYTAQFIIEYTK